VKRGRKPLPPERRRHVRVTIAVTEECSNGLFLYAQRHREDLSVALSKLLDRLAQREQQMRGHLSYPEIG
jgi:hypothetical protein